MSSNALRKVMFSWGPRGARQSSNCEARKAPVGIAVREEQTVRSSGTQEVGRVQAGGDMRVSISIGTGGTVGMIVMTEIHRSSSFRCGWRTVVNQVERHGAES